MLRFCLWGACLAPLLLLAIGCRGKEEASSGPAAKTGLPPSPPQLEGSIPGGPFNGKSPGGVSLVQTSPHLFQGPPQVVVRDGFQEGTASVKIFGVCSLTESSVDCWSLQGVRNADLARRIAQELQPKPTDSPLGNTVSIRYGFKNRIVVFDVAEAAGAFEPKFIGWQVGNDPRRTYLTPLFGAAQPNPPAVGSRAWYVAASLHEQSTDLNFALDRPVSDAAQLACKTGAKATFDGKEFSIRRIGVSNGRSWRIQVETDPAFAKSLSLTLTPLDSKGRTFGWVDKNGKPIPQPIDPDDQPGSIFAVARVDSNQAGAGLFEMITFVDPQYIDSITIRASKRITGRIEGIPLDPK